MSVNLILFNVFYIVFATSSSSKLLIVECEAIGIILHFFLLTSFFLMSSMTILRYLLTIEVFQEFRHFNKISILISYGLSAIIIAITASVTNGPIKYVKMEKNKENM
jgi:hypothetical protein